ncbi:MAG: FmdE family protein [Bacteroidota bacterium]|nr:FmdE family protein [Bacteroidota bacterium]
MKKIMILNILLIALVSCNNYQTDKKGSFIEGKNSTKLTIYQQAGVINIKDPMASMVGYRKPSEDLFKISLDDVGKYSGHMCAGIASGFLMSKQALEVLYPNGDIPVRGNIRVVASDASDQIDVASYITGARAHYGRDEVNANDLIIDTKLQGEKGTFTMVFKRKDNDKMVKAVFNKNKLFGAEALKMMMPLKEKIETATANKYEKKLFAEKVQSIVAQLIYDSPKGTIIIYECTDYNFPNK